MKWLADTNEESVNSSIIVGDFLKNKCIHTIKCFVIIICEFSYM